MLVEKLGGQVRLTDAERRRLARLGRRIGRKARVTERDGDQWEVTPAGKPRDITPKPQRGTIPNTPVSPTYSSDPGVGSRPTDRTSSESPTSRISRPGPASCTWRWCCMSGAGVLSGGPWRRTCARSWSWTRWPSPSSSASHERHSPRGPGLPVHIDPVRPAVHREAGVRPSMGSVDDAYDNAMAESFFATLECELLDAAFTHKPRPGWPSSTSSSGADSGNGVVTGN